MKYIIGIDEAGRGPLAGPVSVGAFVFLTKSAERIFRGVKESKQLSPEQREVWFKKIQDARRRGLIDYRVGMVSASVIDSKGIVPAIKSAMGRALQGLHLDPADIEVLLDGGLKAPPEYRRQKTIIKGDVKIRSIALASICAKVTRDRVMCRLAKAYPKYDFHIHKGYGTKSHANMIRKNGLCFIHRRSFCTSFIQSHQNRTAQPK